jgi:CHASE3 domain sensor protein
MAISLPLAMLAAIAMVAINEVGYQRSNQALEAMAHTQSTRNAINHLMQNMLDAETGLRAIC